jgi:hypothetical protein
MSTIVSESLLDKYGAKLPIPSSDIVSPGCWTTPRIRDYDGKLTRRECTLEFQKGRSLSVAFDTGHAAMGVGDDGKNFLNFSCIGGCGLYDYSLVTTGPRGDCDCFLELLGEDAGCSRHTTR